MSRTALFGVVGFVVGVAVAAACSNGPTVTSTCGPQNCAGCCADAVTCVAGDLHSQCGSNGAVCVSCSFDQVCAGRGICTVPDGGLDGGTDGGTDGGSHVLRNVFVIMMENSNWDDIWGNTANAPYINSLLPYADYLTNYHQADQATEGIMWPSLPNYLWLEGGDNFGIIGNDYLPTDNFPLTHRPETDHLVSFLEDAGITWGAWMESIDGGSCPLGDEQDSDGGHYKVGHDPFVYFDDITNNNDPNASRCIQHVRPYTEFKAAVAANAPLPRYNFITPNLCDDMHDNCTTGNITQGDTWLSNELPGILGSPAYADGGVVFILWDESHIGTGCPQAPAYCAIPMIVLSPWGRRTPSDGGYSSHQFYDHSSTLRSIQDIFHVQPYLRAAAGAQNLSELFTQFP